MCFVGAAPWIERLPRSGLVVVHSSHKSACLAPRRALSELHAEAKQIEACANVLLEGGPQRPQPLKLTEECPVERATQRLRPPSTRAPQASADPSPSLLRGLLRRDARAACPTSRSPHSATAQCYGPRGPVVLEVKAVLALFGLESAGR